MKRERTKRVIKRHDSKPVVGNASLEFIIDHIVEVVDTTSRSKQTIAQKQAAVILARCLANRYRNDHPTPFGDSAGEMAVDAAHLWSSGDLATGRGGSEFVYVYSPTSLVQQLMADALKLTSAPIRASSPGKTIERKISRKGAQGLAQTFATAGTVYVLNNLRDKLNEAIEDLFVEARTAVQELHSATIESCLSELSGTDNDPVKISQSRFTGIIKSIIEEGDIRRRKRLRLALWEIARGRGRPKGARTSNMAPRFSKSEFFAQLRQKINGLSRKSEAGVTRKDVATALGLSNAKALDRLRSQFGDKRAWREVVQVVADE